MNTTNNYILITIDSEFEDKLSHGSLNLEAVTFNANIVDKNDDVIYNSNAHKRNYGTVVGLPSKLTDDLMLYQEHIGEPEPTKYMGHDTLKKFRVMKIDYVHYECGVFEHKKKTAADIKMDVMLGDKIYFHFNTLEEENKIKLPDGSRVYKLSYQNAICVVRNSKYSCDPRELFANLQNKKFIIDSRVEVVHTTIIPIGGRVLIEPFYDEDIQDIDNGQGFVFKGKLAPSGLVTEVDSKPRHLEGIVRYLSLLKGEETELEPGDRVIYQSNSDWTVNIEGKDYYCMRTIDIEAKIV